MGVKFKLKEAVEAVRKKEPIPFSLKRDGITQSLLTSWRKCPTRTRIAMKGYYIPGASKALIFGSVFHSALEWSLSQLKERAGIPEWFSEPSVLLELMDALKNEFQDEYNEANGDGKSFFDESYEMVPIIIPRYFKYWKEDFFGDTKKEFVEIERSFSTPFNDLITLRGKRDGIYAEPSGAKWLMEHKTKGMIPEEALSMTISRDLQVMMYSLAYYLETGEHLRGVLYNIIRRPGLRKKAIESRTQFMQRVLEDIDSRPQHYFIRFPAPVSVTAIEAFRIKFEKEINRFIEWTQEDEKFDIQHTHECTSMFGKCPFLQLCDSEGTDYSMLQVRKSHHPEL